MHTGPAAEPASVRVASDGRFLFVRFDVTQRGPVIATQHSNDTVTGGSQRLNGALSWSSDDAVWVDLWPTGATGFQYQFEANPNGSHNESFERKRRLLTALGIARRASRRGLHRHDGDSAQRAARRPQRQLAGAIPIRYVRATGAQIIWSF